MGDENKKPKITVNKTRPYMINNLEILEDCKGKRLPVKPVMAFCRCGLSKNKPMCDGSHKEKGIDGEKKSDRVADRIKDYTGKKITIHDNRGICSHDGSCFRFLPSVFNMDARPWIDPNGAEVEEIIETIKKCPSGALSYSLKNKRYQENECESMIKLAKNGPLEVRGSIILEDDQDSVPECREHYTLCRCGGSKNQPFCDGTHLKNGFKDRQ